MKRSVNIIHKTIWLALFCVALLVSAAYVPQNAYALENGHPLENLEIELNFPYHQVLHPYEGYWTLARIEITNQAPERLGGSVQLYGYRSDSFQEIMLAEQNVQVEAFEEKQLAFTVPTNLFQEKALIRFLTTDGEEALVEWENPFAHQPVPQLTIVSEKENEFHFLTLLENEYIRFPVTRTILPAELAEEAWLYHESILALGHVSEAGLTPQQMKALETWVRSGGVLIISGGESLLSHAETISHLLPIQLSKEREPLKLAKARTEQLLAQFELPHLPELPFLLRGEPKPQALAYPDKELPLVVSWSYGKGIVMVTTYDVSEEPLASWSGNRKFWNDVFEKSGALYRLLKEEQHDAERLRLAHLSQQIPELIGPSIGMITIIWLIYLVVVGPLLYLVLKRVDKREWAWLIIPVLVLLTSISVYALGIQRFHPAHSHLVSTIQILDQEAGILEGSASFFVLEGKEFSVDIADGVQAIPVAKRNQPKSMKSYLQQTEDENNPLLRYEQVPYMSLTDAKAMGLTDRLGYIEHQLWVEKDQLVGWLTNKTVLDLEQVELQLGKVSYSLGSLAQNEKVEIELPLAKYYFQVYNYEDTYSVLKPYHETRMNMKNQLMPSGYTPNRPTVDLYALSHTPLEMLQLNKEKTKAHYTHMIWQELPLEQKTGEKGVYPYGALPVYLGSSEFQRGDYYAHEAILPAGSSVALDFQVSPFSLQMEKIHIPLDEAVFSPFTIKLWNVQTNEWELLEGNRKLELGEADLAKYVNKQGILTLSFENQREQDFQLPYPLVQVEGEWK